MTAEESLPPGQVWGKKFVIYAALGIPRVAAGDWRLRVDGMVKQPMEYTYAQLTSGELFHYTRSFHCLVPGSLVYANPEPDRVEDVKVGDYIIGADGLRHRVQRLIRKNHSGTVVGIKVAYLPPVLMTPDHPVLIVDGHPGVGKDRSDRRLKTFGHGFRTRWVRADEVKLGDYAFFPKYRYTSKRTFISFEESRFRIDARLSYTLGWYVAEGSAASSDGRTISFSLGVRDADHVQKLRDTLEDLFDARTSVYGNDRGTLLKVVVTSSRVRNLAKMLKTWCGNDALSKRIPDFILNADCEILSTFLRALFDGDGYTPFRTGKGSRRSDFLDFTTGSKILAYQLVLALSKLSIPANILNHPGSVRDGFSVRVRGLKARILFPNLPSYEKVNKFHYWETNEGFYFPMRMKWTEPYTGPVYDFQASGFTMLSPFVTQDCVTQWSIKDVEWDGVQIRKLVEPAGVDPEAKWVMFHCVDGYTAPVPAEDALHEDSIVAFRLNGKQLSAEQGFPARPFMPQLYAWKSAKWLNRIEFVRDYSDGYWEMFGYHERANAWEEERFKGHVGKHSKKTAYGTA